LRFPRANAARIALILFALATVGYVATYGVNVPYHDEWDLIPAVRAFYDHRLTASVLWAQYTENRMVVSRLLLILLALTTRLNVKVEMFAGLAVVFVTSGVAVRAICKYGSINSPWLAVAIVYVVASWGQEQNYLWGLQIDYFSLSLCIVSIASLLVRPSNRRLLAALAIAVVATGLSMQGLLSWIVGAVALAQSKTPWRRRLVWGAAGTLALIFYFHGYSWATLRWVGRPSTATDGFRCRRSATPL
jgi:hypothetical protein